MIVRKKWDDDSLTVGTSFDKKTHVSLLQKRAVSGSAKKAYDKCHYCKFCGTRIVNKIQRHLLTVHQGEEEVKQILFLPKRSKERSLLLRRLTNDGNFQHNIDVLREGNGHLVVGRRSELNTKTASRFTVCVFCKKWQSKSNLWRHLKTCIEKIEYHKNHPVTVTEDLQLFRSFLIRKIRELSDRLRKRCNSRDWVMLAKCTMSRLILFNKRRRNEVRELKVNDYLARPNWRNNDCGEMAMALSSTDRLLANR